MKNVYIFRTLMHIVTCSNCLDSKRIVALRTGVNEKKIFLQIFTQKSSCKLSILLVQNISVLDKLVSCVRVDYGNKTQMLLIQFFIDSIQINSLQIHRGIVDRDERYHYALRSAEVLKFVSVNSSCLHPPQADPFGIF